MIDNSWMLQGSHYNQPTYCWLICDVSPPSPPTPSNFLLEYFYSALQACLLCFLQGHCYKRHPHQETLVRARESNIKLSDLTRHAGYSFFFVQASISPFNSNLGMSGQQRPTQSLHKIPRAHPFYVAPFESIFPNTGKCL